MTDNTYYMKDPEASEGFRVFSSAADFCDEFGLIRALVPFPNTSSTPIKWLSEITNELATLPPTAQSAIISDMEMNCNSAGAHRPYFQTLCWIAGTWEAPGTQRVANPDYIHDGPELEFDSQEEIDAHIRELASVGVLSQQDIAARLPMAAGSMWKYMSRRGIPWEDLREQGRARFGRTIAVVYAWTNYSMYELADACDQPESTLRTWADRYARDADTFTVPPQPKPRKRELDIPGNASIEEWYPDAHDQLRAGGRVSAIARENPTYPPKSVMRYHLRHECNCDHTRPPLAYSPDVGRWVRLRAAEPDREQGVPADD